GASRLRVERGWQPLDSPQCSEAERGLRLPTWNTQGWRVFLPCSGVFCGQGKCRHAERMKWNLWNGMIEAGRLLLGLKNEWWCECSVAE
ncbi:MAG: hypothetical protein LBL13_03030, partial [Bacteroidales bacterium]|nr:hypothetical protein [Bacteroidales bacterium]